MRFAPLTIIFLLLYSMGGFSFLSSVAIVIWLWFVWDLFENANKQIAFREYILVLYGLNYLFSPALSYLLDNKSIYRMKIPEHEYFILAIPCILLLRFGMNVIKTKAFKVDFNAFQLQSKLNQDILLTWLYTGVFFVFFGSFFPSEIGFFIYLVAGIRFVAAFGLYVLDARKYKWHLFGVLAVEVFMSLKNGMFHDTLMWILFFGLFWTYVKNPGTILKVLIGVCIVISVYILQITKSEYRSQLGDGKEGAGLENFQDAVLKNVNDKGGLFKTSKTVASITRVNQAWIFASAVNRMNRYKDYQGMTLFSKYAESAFFPRILAPNKLGSGDKQIFNRFSGHYINPGTSMGLGFFADGYIAFGAVGAYLSAFILGLIFSIIFRSVESWAQVSPFFILFMFPIMNYAVRPDCETQTVLGHVVKGLFVFTLVAKYYAGYFSKKQGQIQLAEERSAMRLKGLAKRKRLNRVLVK